MKCNYRAHSSVRFRQKWLVGRWKIIVFNYCRPKSTSHTHTHTHLRTQRKVHSFFFFSVYAEKDHRSVGWWKPRPKKLACTLPSFSTVSINGNLLPAINNYYLPSSTPLCALALFLTPFLFLSTHQEGGFHIFYPSSPDSVLRLSACPQSHHSSTIATL